MGWYEIHVSKECETLTQWPGLGGQRPCRLRWRLVSRVCKALQSRRYRWASYRTEDINGRERCSPLFVIKEIQSEMAPRCHFTPTGLSNRTSACCQRWRRDGTLLLGVWEGRACL